jgi:Luciferase-like monooxygenase
VAQDQGTERGEAHRLRPARPVEHCPAGRRTLGVGLGSDHFGGELSATGEQLDDRRRGQMLDEALQILTAAWSGRRVHYHGEHYTVDGIQFLPRPVRQTVPVWVAGFPGNIRPLRRAARYDGFFPVNLQHPGQLAETAATLTGLRQHTTGCNALKATSVDCPVARDGPPVTCSPAVAPALVPARRYCIGARANVSG